MIDFLIDVYFFFGTTLIMFLTLVVFGITVASLKHLPWYQSIPVGILLALLSPIWMIIFILVTIGFIIYQPRIPIWRK